MLALVISGIVIGCIYAVAGFGLLELVGIRVSGHFFAGFVDVAKLFGLAYVVGLASTSVVLIGLLCAGVSLGDCAGSAGPPHAAAPKAARKHDALTNGARRRTRWAAPSQSPCPRRRTRPR